MTSVRKRRMTSRATAGAYANTRIGTPVPAAGAEGRPDEGVSGDWQILYACSNWFRWRYAMYKRHKIRGFYFTARHWTQIMHPGFNTDIGGIRIFFVQTQSHIVWVNIPPRYQHFHQLRDKPRRTSKQLQSALSRSSYTSQPLTSAIATIDSRIVTSH